MNIISVLTEKVMDWVQKDLKLFAERTYVQIPIILPYTDDFIMSALTFDNYLIQDMRENALFKMFIEIVDRNDLPIEMEDLNPNRKKIIHFINYYEKTEPKDNLYEAQSKGTVFPYHPFTPLELFIAPQIVINDGQKMIDLYHEPGPKSVKHYLKFCNAQKLRRAIMALSVLNYVELNLKKEKHRIKREMPTPELIEKITSENKHYENKPIKIKDISVQYVYEPHETREYTRHCEAWGVRGHYRHLPNGKVIYIKPHIRGKGKIKDTVYEIERRKK